MFCLCYFAGHVVMARGVIKLPGVFYVAFRNCSCSFVCRWVAKVVISCYVEDFQFTPRTAVKIGERFNILRTQ